MSSFPTPTRIAAALILAGALASVPVSAQDLETAVQESYPTNLTMVREATRAAVAELFMGFTAPAGATLLVEPGRDHTANWFVESNILSYLSEAGYQAFLKEAPLLGPPLPQAKDSLAAGSGKAETRENPELVLRYGVVDFAIFYPDNYRTSPLLGSRKVQRQVSVSLQAQLLRGKREDVVWVGSGDVDRLDVVPASKLSLLEGRDFPFEKPTLETRGVGSLVEPALVSGIVAGLIYLFYSNQN